MSRVKPRDLQNPWSRESLLIIRRHTPHHASSSLLILAPHIDAGDDSLQRYKESLGLGGGKDLSDPSDPRVCIILSLTMNSEGRPPVTVDLSAKGAEKTLKDKPFKIKEGAKFTMTAKFKVQHDVLSGLQYVQVVKRKGIRLSKDQEMIVSGLEDGLVFLFALVITDTLQGSYAPNTDKTPFYSKKCK
jgi:Rho GDP-dissociation inhibitor